MPQPVRFPILLFCTALFALLSGFLVPARAQTPQSEEILDRDVSEKVRLKYLLALPEGYQDDPAKRWPLVVFLHGAGERGDDLTLVKKHGPPKLVEQGKKFPFILVSPQCPAESWWPWEPVLDLIDDLETRLRVDKDRVCLTGLSMGGYGTWEFAVRAPHRFAAIAPVCGGGTPYQMKRIPHLPVWAFHGAKDTAVDVSESQRLIEALKKAKNPHVKLTIYPEAKHDSWTEAYNTEDLYDWLLSHKRSGLDPR